MLIVFGFILASILLVTCVDKKKAGTYVPTDNEKATCDSLFSVAEKLAGSNITLATIYANKAYSMIKVQKCKDGIARFHMIKGLILYYDDNYTESINHLDTAIVILKNTGNKAFLAKSYSFLSGSNACMGNYPQAIESSLTAISLFKELDDKTALGRNYNFLGSIYLEQGDTEKSLAYLDKAKYVLSDDTLSIHYSNVLSVLGSVYFKQTLYSDAREYFDRAYDIRLESANIRLIASSLVQMAELHIATNLFKKAKDCLEEAEEIYIQLNEDMGLFNVYNLFAEVNLKQGNFIKADANIEKAHEIAHRTNSNNLLVKAAEGLYRLHKKQNHYEQALVYLEEYQHYQDQLLSSEKNRLIINLEQNYELQDKIKNNQILVQQNKIKTQHLTLLWLALGLLIIVLAALIILMLYRKKVFRQTQIISEKKRKMAETEQMLLEKEKVILQNNLELKNKELTSKTVELIHQIETLQTISDRISKLDASGSKKEMELILHDLKLKNREKVWDDFHTAFNNVHKEFYDRLFEICPDLSSTEIKMAALLKLNLSTKEIAAISYKSESAIKTTRHRLRQKLNLKAGEDLVTFLLKI